MLMAWSPLFPFLFIRKSSIFKFHHKSWIIKLMFKLSKFWRETIIFSLVVFLFTSLFQYFLNQQLNLFVINRSFADTAVILIGLSFALSGITFFTSYFKNKLAYRKQLGIIGFIAGIIHFSVTVFFLSNLYPFPKYFLGNPLPFIFSISAVIVFTIMTIVSNFGIPAKIGGVKWRRILRTGYIAIFFLIFHFGLLNFRMWQFWLSKPDFPPPGSLLILLFSLFVLLLRAALFLKIKK